MHIENLVDIIRQWEFLQSIPQLPFDAILWERYPETPIDTIKNSQGKIIQHELFSKLWYDMRPQWDIIAWIKQHKHVLLILDTIDTKTISSLLPALPASTIVSVWNLGAGVLWVKNKHTLDNQDIDVMNPYFTIYEPIDYHHFQFLVGKEENAYVRIPGVEMMGNLFDEAHSALYENEIISLQDFWYSGTTGVVLTMPHLLASVSQALQHLQVENGVGYDLLVFQQVCEKLSDSAKEILSHADRLFVIHDQKDNIAFEKWISSIKSVLPTHLSIHYHHANYDTLQTFLTEYAFMQAKIDAEDIVAFLYSK